MTNLTIVHGSIEQGEADMLSQRLERYGFSTRLVQGRTERSAEEVILILLLGIPLRTFLEAFGTSLGESAGAAFKKVIEEIFRKSDGRNGGKIVIIRDFKSGRDYELNDRLPKEAYEQLISEGSPQAGRLHYDDAIGEWTE